MGFCFGGSITWLLAVRNPEIRAAVPFYGSAPPLEEVPNMNVPVLGIFGSEDNRINAGVPDLEAALKGLGKTYKFRTFEGPTTPSSTIRDVGTIPKLPVALGGKPWLGSKPT